MSAAVTYGRNDAVNFMPSLVASDEARLLASARAGDSTAFERLVMPHWGALLRVAQRILHNREDAEDAVQTAFLDAFRNLERFQGRARFSSWLTRIAMNAALMRLRSSRKERITSLDDLSETGPVRDRLHLAEKRQNPEQQYLSMESQALLKRGLKRLGPLYLEVLHLRGEQELTAKEVAVLLEVPVGTVKARLHRARVQLTRYTQSVLTRKRKLSQA